MNQLRAAYMDTAWQKHDSVLYDESHNPLVPYPVNGICQYGGKYVVAYRLA